LTHALRPIFAATVLAFGLAAATGSQAASPMNYEGLKSSFTYTPIVGESLNRIIAKTMPNIDIKQDLVAEAFKALNPEQFNKGQSSVTNSSMALKVPNQNQLANLIDTQLNKIPAQNLLNSTVPATPKVNPKTETWVRFPSKMVALTQKMESWIRYPAANNSELHASAESKSWVRYPSMSSQNSAISTSTQIDQSEWVRYIAKN
jgi:Tfp pilus assembly protein FimV